MSRLGLKEGDTMHGFYKAPTNDSNSSQNFGDSANNNGQQRRNEHDDDEFDELARYFLPLAGSLLGKNKWGCHNCRSQKNHSFSIDGGIHGSCP